MDPTALGLVLVSALLHACRDFLTKRGINKQAFSWWYHLFGVCFILPFFLYRISSGVAAGTWKYAAASGSIHAVYFYMLAEAYKEGDLSLVYPIARSAPLFVMAWSTLIWKEWVSPVGALGILIVVAGAYLLQLQRYSLPGLIAPFRALLRDRSVRLAWGTAILVAAYSLVDDRGVQVVDPLVYLFVYGAIGFLLYTPYVLTRHHTLLRSEWCVNWQRILPAGLLSPFGYLLALFALQLAHVGYVSAIRQLSIVFGVILGSFLLQEPYGKIRLVASLIMFCGMSLIASKG